MLSVEFDLRVYPVHKGGAGIESDSPIKQKEYHTHYENLTKITKLSNKSVNICFCVEEKYAIEEKVKRRSTSCQEGSPPPMIVLQNITFIQQIIYLSNQLEVTVHYRSFGRDNDKNQKHDELRSKCIVELVMVHCTQDKKELY